MSAASRPGTIVQAAAQLSHLPVIHVLRVCWEALPWLAAINALCAVGLLPGAALWALGTAAGDAGAHGHGVAGGQVAVLGPLLAPVVCALTLAPAAALAARVAPRVLRGEAVRGRFLKSNQATSPGSDIPGPAAVWREPGQAHPLALGSRRRSAGWVRAVASGCALVGRVVRVLAVAGLAGSALVAALMSPVGLPVWWRAAAAWLAGATLVTATVLTPWALATAARPGRPRATWRLAALRAGTQWRATLAMTALMALFVAAFFALAHTAVLILPGPLAVAAASVASRTTSGQARTPGGCRDHDG